MIGIPHIELRTRARLIMCNIRDVKNKRILDAGCGIGLYSLELANKGAQVTGVDINTKKITIAQNLANKMKIKNVFFERGDLTNLKLKSDYFDKIICSDVLEHIKNDEKAVKELFRVLKKGGEIIFTFPRANKHNAETMLEFGHVRAGYLPRDFKEKMEKIGFKSIKSGGYTYFFGKLAWNISNVVFKNKYLTVLMFYPLYALSLLDKFMPKSSDSNGLFFKAIKI